MSCSWAFSWGCRKRVPNCSVFAKNVTSSSQKDELLSRVLAMDAMDPRAVRGSAAPCLPSRCDEGRSASQFRDP